VILVSLTRAGTVGLRPKTRADRARLRSIPYVKRTRSGVGATWWTYLSDLRRDVPARQLCWDPGVVGRLRALKLSLDERLKGDDDEVLREFADGVEPYRFQIQAIHCALNVKRLLIADDTGLGKTIETIGTMQVAMARGLVRRAILVVPSGVKVQWYEEIHRFARCPPDPIVVVMGGSPKTRKTIYKKSWRVLVINPELVRIDSRHIDRVEDVDFVVLDEASCIRNPDTAIAYTMKELFKRTKFRLALTATPVENRLADLWSVFEWVDRRVFLSKRYFDSRYIVWKKRKLTVYSNRLKRNVTITKEEPLRYRKLREVQAKIRPAYIRRRVSDVEIELPGLIVKWETIHLPKRQRLVYEAIKDKVIAKLAGLRGAALRAPLQALRQACNSTALVERAGGQKPVHAKVDRIRELLETELAGEQVIVFTDYERFVRLMMDELRQYRPVAYTGKMTKRDKQRAVEAFRLGDRRLLLGTKALERGHNLQNASIVINVDLPWNPAAVAQRIGRIRRIGSEHGTCRLINMIAKGTVEEKLIMRKLYLKNKLFLDLFESASDVTFDLFESMGGAEVADFL